MTTHNYEGDPCLYIDEHGSYLKIDQGQPVMDAGIENAVLISLLTRTGWCGNIFFKDPKKIGSRFLQVADKPITRQSSLDLEDAARKALDWLIDTGTAREVEVRILNTSTSRELVILIHPPSASWNKQKMIRLINSGINWQYQREIPAHQ